MSINYVLDPKQFISPDLPCIGIDSHNSQKSTLHRDHCFIGAFSAGLPPENVSIADIMQAMEIAINKACAELGFPKVNPNAFNNARGTWFEYLIAISLWNLRIDFPKTYTSLIVKLPNVSTMKFIDLFEPKTHNMLNDLERSLGGQGVNLVTSNPDLLCVTDLEGLNVEKECLIKFENCTQDCLNTISTAYNLILGKCKYNSIKFGIALKSSTRPDRRLQIPHEGSILKAINAHLQTRFWDPSHDVRYYAATASPITEADIKAFKTAATHSITDVNVRPMAAVDKPFYLATLADTKAMFIECMT